MKNAFVCLLLAACAVGCASASVMSQREWETCAEDAKTGNEAAMRAKSWSDSTAMLYGMGFGFLLGGGIVMAVGAAATSSEDDSTSGLLVTMGGVFVGISLLDLLIAIPVDLQSAKYAKAWLEGIGTGRAATHATRGTYGRFVPDRRGGFRFLREEAKASLPARRS
jgi:hypothetical protein